VLGIFRKNFASTMASYNKERTMLKYISIDLSKDLIIVGSKEVFQLRSPYFNVTLATKVEDCFETIKHIFPGLLRECGHRYVSGCNFHASIAGKHPHSHPHTSSFLTRKITGPCWKYSNQSVNSLLCLTAVCSKHLVATVYSWCCCQLHCYVLKHRHLL
jgi:hypothetical protein